MTTKIKHKKHAGLARPKMGHFARNEWAFIGAPCSVIRDLVEKIASLSKYKMLYIDESHDHDATVNNLSIATKKQEAQEMLFSGEWDNNTNPIEYNDFDFVFINGNHFKAEKQFVILHEKKRESLSRKLDRLTNVKGFIISEKDQKLYDFLDDETSASIPQFHIDQVEKIWEYIQDDYETPKLKALVLAGGKSQRMGRDKADINYHGKRQVRHVYEMLESFEIPTYLSCRPDQSKLYEQWNRVEDKFMGLGPFGAIASAFMSDPNSAWLVVPCDLPLLDRSHIETLTQNRNAHKQATAFLNNDTQFPEPLISIWEPKVYQRMLQFLAKGYSCPRKVLINSDVQLIHTKEQQFMMNANTPEDMRRAQTLLKEKK